MNRDSKGRFCVANDMYKSQGRSVSGRFTSKLVDLFPTRDISEVEHLVDAL